MLSNPVSQIPGDPVAPPFPPSTPPPFPPSHPLIVTDQLSRSYGRTHALVGVCLTIGAGESVAVMGRSGSGKSTLLHCLSGILPASSGTICLQLPGGQVRLEGLDAAGRARLRREHLGFIFQQGMLVPELTAAENIALPLMLNGVPRATAEQQATGWLSALGLPGLGERRIGQLSGGQAQRVAIARAQVTNPAVVFADEPTGALDSRSSAEVMSALLGSTTGQGRTLVVVTHDITVARCCSRILTLADGRIVSDQRRPAERVEAGAR